MALAALVLLVLRVVSVPAEPKVRLCGFYWLTHRPCPFCGLTRAMFSLAKFRFAEALHFHLLSPLVMVVLLGWMLAAVVRAVAPGSAWRLSPVVIQRLTFAYAILFGGYGLLRMLA